MKESDLYRPLDLPQELTSLGQDVLCRLRNVVLSHGVGVGGSGRTLAMTEPHRLSVTTSNHPENRSMIIIGDGGVTRNGSFVFRLVETPGFESATVIWDRRVTVAEAEELIQRAPEIGQAMKEALASGRSLKMQVAEVFAEPGAVFPVLPGGHDAETILEEFDHPEELVVMQDLGMQTICHRRDIPYLEQRRRVALAVLREEGIDLAEVGNLGIDRILALNEKITQRLRQ